MTQPNSNMFVSWETEGEETGVASWYLVWSMRHYLLYKISVAYHNLALIYSCSDEKATYRDSNNRDNSLKQYKSLDKILAPFRFV